MITQAGKVSGELFLDRDPHINYVLRNTIDPESERTLFLKNLKAYVNK